MITVIHDIVYVRACMYVFIYTCVIETHIHTYIYIYTYTCINTHVCIRNDIKELGSNCLGKREFKDIRNHSNGTISFNLTLTLLQRQGLVGLS